MLLLVNIDFVFKWSYPSSNDLDVKEGIADQMAFKNKQKMVYMLSNLELINRFYKKNYLVVHE